MYEIAKAESNLKTTAFNPEWHYKNGEKYCQGSWGILQVACINYEGNPTDLFDIKLNLKMASKVLKQQGLNAWGVCRNKVKCYLSET